MSTIYLMRVKSFGLIMAILAIVASQAFAADTTVRRASDPGPYVENDSFTPEERNLYNLRNDPVGTAGAYNSAVISSDALTLPGVSPVTTTVQPRAAVTVPASTNIPPRRASEPGPYVDNDSFTPVERDAYNIRNDPSTTIPGVTVAPIQSTTLTNPITMYPTSARAYPATPVYGSGRVYPATPVYGSAPVYYNQTMPYYSMGYSSMAAYSGLPRRASDPVPYPDNDSFTSFEKDIYNLRR